MRQLHFAARSRILLAAVIVTLLLPACSVLQTASPTAPPTASVTASPQASPSATLPPENTATPQPVPTAEPFTPTPAPTLPVPDHQIRILILGSDIREDNSFRTDVIMLLTINPREGTASVVSFPRDLYIYMPGWGFSRINVVQYRGFDVMADMFEMNFGVRPQYYVMTNFAGFLNIIDSLGGIDVVVAEEMTDKCDLPHMDREGNCTVRPGTVRMDGQYALWYVRSRKSTSDFDRQRRAQEVIQGIFRRLLSLEGVRRAPEIYQQFSGSAETNLDLQTVLSLAGVIPSLTQEGRIRRYQLGIQNVYPMIDGEGAAVLYPDLPSIRAIIEEAVQNTTP